MANDISSTVWRIDTLPFAYTGPVYIIGANWTDQVTAGDQCVFQTTGSKPIIDSKAQTANYQQNFGKLGWQNGIKGVTLTSGVLNIAVGAGK